ncbi:putative transposase/invertase (TIGR01784 family) [Geobacillus subterraneus]
MFEKYRAPIIPIAVFSYDAIRDEPSSFTLSFPFRDVLDFRFFHVELRKQNWRQFVRTDNPVAAALFSKMDYTENERVELKKQFLRMLVRLQLDEARQRLLMGFFETYMKLSDEEEQQLRREVEPMEMKEKEQVLELIISYEQKGKIQGREEGRKEGAEQEKRHIAKRMLHKGVDAQTIQELIGLSVTEIEEMKQGGSK